MIKIHSLKDTSFDELYRAFAQAFADYDAPTITRDALKVMLERRGFSAEYSFGAFDDDKLVSFTFNGIGKHNGKQTAYDTGTGTIESHRGKGLAGKVFEESIPFLKSKEVQQYLLEVLQHNTAAFNIYKKQGFEIVREFNYYITDSKDVKPSAKKLPNGFLIKEIELPNAETIAPLWSFEPSWQNNLEAIKRRASDFKTLGVYKGDSLVGYGIIEPGSGDITQIAINESYRKLGLSSVLMNELIKINKHHLLKMINSEKGYTPMEKFMESLHIPLSGTQYEMIRHL